jgi:hypothetical protein
VAYDLDVPRRWKPWKVKIREDERSEEPHVTFIHKTTYYRWGLRQREFMDDPPPPRNVPPELVAWVEEQWETLRTEWDAKYPHNPV